MSAGPSAQQRLDPNALPVRFTADDAMTTARAPCRDDRGGVRVRRSVRGMAINVAVPVDAFLGVALPLTRATASATTNSRSASSTAIRRFRSRCLPPLTISTRLPKWQRGRVLGVPLLIADATGALSEPFPTLGAVRGCGAPGPRGAGDAIKRRRAWVSCSSIRESSRSRRSCAASARSSRATDPVLAARPRVMPARLIAEHGYRIWLPPSHARTPHPSRNVTRLSARSSAGSSFCHS